MLRWSDLEATSFIRHKAKIRWPLLYEQGWATNNEAENLQKMDDRKNFKEGVMNCGVLAN